MLSTRPRVVATGPALLDTAPVQEPYAEGDKDDGDEGSYGDPCRRPGREAGRGAVSCC